MGVIEILQIATFFILAISAAVSTWMFYRIKNKEREKETFDYIDDKFNEYLQICLEKPYLDIFDTKDDKESVLDDKQIKEERVAFAYLMSIFERVYIFYVENRRKCDDDQFVSWTKTMKEYLKRDNFKKAWRENGYGWDPGFIAYMDSLYLKVENKIKLDVVKTKADLEDWYKEYENHFIQDRNNDSIEQINSYFNDKGKYPYHFYNIKTVDGSLVGGILTQKIGKFVVILYIFISKNARGKGYGSLALRALRQVYKANTTYLAEVEHRNKKKLPWWLNRMFEKVRLTYYTPDVNQETHEEKEAVNENDLVIYYVKTVKPKDLKKTIDIYLKTSFVHRPRKDISHFKSVQYNTEQVMKMKKMIDTE